LFWFHLFFLGAGKTHLAKKIAEQCDLKFLEISRIVTEHGFQEEYDPILECPILDEDKVSHNTFNLVNSD
jgi:adenylate kinase